MLIYGKNVFKTRLFFFIFFNFLLPQCDHLDLGRTLNGSHCYSSGVSRATCDVTTVIRCVDLSFDIVMVSSSLSPAVDTSVHKCHRSNSWASVPPVAELELTACHCHNIKPTIRHTDISDLPLFLPPPLPSLALTRVTVHVGALSPRLSVLSIRLFFSNCSARRRR